jgi:hypothetical protein
MSGPLLVKVCGVRVSNSTTSRGTSSRVLRPTPPQVQLAGEDVQPFVALVRALLLRPCVVLWWHQDLVRLQPAWAAGERQERPAVADDRLEAHARVPCVWCVDELIERNLMCPGQR